MANNNFRTRAKEIEALLKRRHDECVKVFIVGAYDIHKGIIQNYYSNSGKGLRRITGRAANSWQVVIDKKPPNISAAIFSAGVPYANQSRQKVIAPTKSKFLVIPVGAALTSAGAQRFPGDANGRGSIAQAERELGSRQKAAKPYSKRLKRTGSPLQWIKKGSDTWLVMAKKGISFSGLTKDDRLMFVLKKKVTIKANTRGLMPYVLGKTNALFRKLQEVS